jgi:hypothetical protein
MHEHGPRRKRSSNVTWHYFSTTVLLYYYLFTAIGFAPGGSGPYTTQLQQNTYNKNKYIPYNTIHT